MIRTIEATLRYQPVLEGAGVRLKRVFGYPRRGFLDPFLLLDHFGSEDPVDYMAGFPWHPHRGIETVTYMLKGEFAHEDSLGNKGTLKSGDIQWMTAGKGILHQEMPQECECKLNGFQLWVNLPAKNKMMDPNYQDIKADDIPEIEWEGTRVRVAAGKFKGKEGPVKDIVVQPTFLDFSVPAGIEQTIRVEKDHTVFVYVYEGSGFFGTKREKLIRAGTMAKLSNGDQVFFDSGSTPVKFILVSGKPLNEPIEWRGPIVMNTKEELYQAFTDYHEGNFIR
jgi:redox-sensitive bicupin YhaK (pirin superfamily)